jgi:hypothetical protein
MGSVKMAPDERLPPGTAGIGLERRQCREAVEYARH